MTLGQTLVTLSPDLRVVEVRSHPSLCCRGGGLELLEQPDLVDALGVADVTDQAGQGVTNPPHVVGARVAACCRRHSSRTLLLEHVFDLRRRLRQNAGADVTATSAEAGVTDIIVMPWMVEGHGFDCSAEQKIESIANFRQKYGLKG